MATQPSHAFQPPEDSLPQASAPKVRSKTRFVKPVASAPAAQPDAKAGKKRGIHDYVDLIETVARVEYSRLPNHLIDYNELVNIGAIALHVLFTSNPDRDFNVTYLSTAIKWAVRNELRYRYKWYSLKQVETQEVDADGEGDGEGGVDRDSIRAVVYETIISMEALMEGENPYEVRDNATTPDQDSELTEMSRIVKEAITKLPERERQIVEARFFKNMKMREIGHVYGISPSRTSRIVQSGLDKVKAELQRRGYVYQPNDRL